MVYGYVHDDNDRYNLPVDIINYVGNWISFETIHFIADNYQEDEADHWLIDVDAVLDNQQNV